MHDKRAITYSSRRKCCPFGITQPHYGIGDINLPRFHFARSHTITITSARVSNFSQSHVSDDNYPNLPNVSISKSPDLVMRTWKKKKKKISKNCKLSKTCNVIFPSLRIEKQLNNDRWKKSRITSNNANAEEIFKGGEDSFEWKKVSFIKSGILIFLVYTLSMLYHRLRVRILMPLNSNSSPPPSSGLGETFSIRENPYDSASSAAVILRNYVE